MTLNRNYAKMLVISGILFISSQTQAQTFPGYQNSHFAGIHGIPTNPASAAGTRYKWDLNIIGLDVKAGNTYMQMTKEAILSGKTKPVRNVDYFLDTAATSKQNAWANADIMLPSFLWSINTESAIAFTWRARVMANGKNNNTQATNLLAEQFPENPAYYNRVITEEYGTVQGHAWNEFGFTYARNIKDEYNGLWKGGVTLKILTGMAAAYATGRDGTAMLQNRGRADVSGTVNYGYNRKLDELDGRWQNAVRLFGTPGVGIDMGLIYEWRPNADGFGGGDDDYDDVWNPDADDYLARFGVSITDIGGIGYRKSDSNHDLVINEKGFPIDTLRKTRQEDYDDYLRRVSSHFDAVPTKRSFYMNLPTALNLSADLKLYPKFYVSLAGSIALTAGQMDDNKTFNLTQFQFTPRYDGRILGLYLPVQMNSYGQTDIGGVLRLGPLVIGSASLFSTLARKQLDHADGFVALRISSGMFGNGSGSGSGLFRKKNRSGIDCPPRP